MKINLASIFVDYQEKALKFYVEVLGFVKSLFEKSKSVFERGHFGVNVLKIR